MGGVVWSVRTLRRRAVIEALYAAGLADCAGRDVSDQPLRPVRPAAGVAVPAGRPYMPLQFRTPGPYRLVRHPLYVGWLMVFWSAPVMTVAHLVFAWRRRLYILIAIQFEERDLMRFTASMRSIAARADDDSYRWSSNRGGRRLRCRGQPIAASWPSRAEAAVSRA